MRIYKEDKSKKEIIFRLVKSDEGFDLDVVNECGDYGCTLLSIQDGAIKVLGDFKGRLQLGGFEDDEFYFNTDGSVKVEYI